MNGSFLIQFSVIAALTYYITLTFRQSVEKIMYFVTVCACHIEIKDYLLNLVNLVA